MDILIEYTNRDNQYCMWRTITYTTKSAVSFLQYVERKINNSTFQGIVGNIAEVIDIFDLDKKDFFEIKHTFKNSVISFDSDSSSVVFLAKSSNETLEININKIQE